MTATLRPIVSRLCSTPEGIEAEDTATFAKVHAAGELCSTPEGIEAEDTTS